MTRLTDLLEVLRAVEPTVAKHGSEVVLYCDSGSAAEQLYEAMEMAVFSQTTASCSLDVALLKRHQGEEALTTKLTDSQFELLKILGRLTSTKSSVSTADICKITRKWPYGQLKLLERKGVIRHLGAKFSGTRRWSVTPEGRSALARAIGGEGE